MSAAKSYTICCDLHPAAHPRDHHGVSMCTWSAGDGLTATDARRMARALGWVRILGKDYCPAAKAALARADEVIER